MVLFHFSLWPVLSNPLLRYAFMHWSQKTLIIGLSAWLILYYFVVYPYKLARHGKLHPH